MRRILFATAVLIFSLAVSAQVRRWSLDECVDYAVAHNINVLQTKVSEDQGRISVDEARSGFMPQVSGYASQSFNFGRGLTADNTYANRNTSSLSVGANLQVPVFQGLRNIRNLEYSKVNLRALVERTEAAKDNVTLNVIGGYLQALYASEMLAVANENLAISRRELERREKLVEAGKIPELDLSEARAQVSRDELTVVNSQNDSITALLDLAQMLNIEDYRNFAILPLSETRMDILSPDEVFASAMRNNHEIKATGIEAEAAQKYVGVARSGYIPSLSFSAGLGTNYYKTSGFTNEDFGAQFRHNFSKSIGFSLSVPIFDGLNTRNSIRRAKAQAAVAALRFDDARNNLYKSITTAYTQAVAAQKKYDASTVAVEATLAAFDAMQVKYNNGRATPTEFSKAKSDYTNALADQVQAKYEAMLRARILAFYNKE